MAKLTNSGGLRRSNPSNAASLSASSAPVKPFEDPARRGEFRAELEALQGELRKYNRLLARIAGVEDLSDLEDLTVSEQVEAG